MIKVYDQVAALSPCDGRSSGPVNALASECSVPTLLLVLDRLEKRAAGAAAVLKSHRLRAKQRDHLGVAFGAVRAAWVGAGLCLVGLHAFGSRRRHVDGAVTANFFSSRPRSISKVSPSIAPARPRRRSGSHSSQSIFMLGALVSSLASRPAFNPDGPMLRRPSPCSAAVSPSGGPNHSIASSHAW